MSRWSSAFVRLFAVGLMLGVPQAATARTVPQETAAEVPPLAAYGALPSLEFVQLSRSGRRLAFISVVGERRILSVIDTTPVVSLGRLEVGDAKVRDLRWIDDDHVLITSSTTQTLPEIGIFRRELSIGQIYDLTAQRVVQMLEPTAGLFPVLMGPVDVATVDGNPAVFVRTHSFQSPRGRDLYRVDPRSGRARRAEAMERDVDEYVLDSSGQSVARSRYDERTQVWSLHLRQEGELQETWRTTAPIDLPSLQGLGLNGDSVIVAADRPDLGREGREDADFFDVSLATGVWRPLRFDFEPTALIFHPGSGRLIGASRLEDDGRDYLFADDEAARLWASVKEAFPGTRPSLSSWSDDLRSAVVFTSGSGDSGSYHLVDGGAGTVVTVGQAYAGVPPSAVGPIAPLSYTAADGLEIHGYLTTPPGREARSLPLVVLVHGGPASRDRYEFDWWGQALASRGYAVLQVNFRGSTGYGEAFLEAGFGEWGRKMQTDLSDGVRHLTALGIVDPGRVCIVGASYGGYAALAGPTLDRGVYRCAVSVAGVSDLRQMVDYAADRGTRRDNDSVRYWNRFMGGDGPRDRSLDARSPARLADQADAPILLIHGRDDTVVPISQSRAMAEALRQAGKPVELMELEGEDHWLSRSDTRLRMLTASVAFLQHNNPPD
ncbi:alpha/beta hydrolase family protein [Brevundimonas subvibrioides]|uniref:alpha/beta hydrolase family protein n=1 Tax=Brevundimonas subvibrioides TaxID=74313 RepID=UPI0022B31591|nr:S9 family peptidase [Brevundimonas subvibrioides]